MWEQVSWEEGVFGVLCILAGLLLCFFGYRLLKPALFCVGCFLGYIVTYTILVAANVTDPYALVFGSWGAGIVVGLLLVCLVDYIRSVLLFVRGFLAGFTFALYILGWSEYALIESVAWRWVFVVSVALVGGFLALMIRKYFDMAATSWSGSYLVILGKEHLPHMPPFPLCPCPCP